jgi:RNA polymerase sigma-70 factor (ECF subfamily)
VRRGGDADDYVQIALLRTLRRLPYLRLGDQTTLQPYLRRVLSNLVHDRARLAGRRPPLLPIDDDMLTVPSSQEDALRAAETFDRYRAAVASLTPRERAALTARLHRHWDYARVARSAGCPSEGAARVMVGRALAKVASRMKVPAAEGPGQTRRAAGPA